MEVLVGKNAGFCGGVKLAVQKTDEAVSNGSNIYCLGDVVHNKQVIERLELKGLKIVYDINDVPNGATMIIRAHGEGKKIYEIAKQKNIEIIDTTCGNVKVIHNKIEKASKDSFIIIIGEKGHPEVLSDVGFVQEENCFVIQDEDDILDAYMKFEESGFSKVYVLSQTTFSMQKFDLLEKEIYTNFVEADVVVDKTICNATETRQNECKDLAKKVNCMVVIGGKSSANTRKLVEIAEENCPKVYFIQTVENLKGESFEGVQKVGIIAGASTPDDIIQEVAKYLEEV